MLHDQLRNKLVVSYAISYLLLASLVVRIIREPDLAPYLVSISWFLFAYFVLFTTERLISSWFPDYIHLYLLFQFLIILLLWALMPEFDYYAILVVPLCFQAFWFLPQHWAVFWIALIDLMISAFLFDRYGASEGLGLALAYVSVSLFVSIFSIVTLRAENARNEAQRLLAELQDAHQKLQLYAKQVQELAAAQERTLLARELHDSVTQTIFSMTLTAQSARILLNRDPERASGQLEHLQDLAQNALSEMRSLIQQMHPVPLSEEGLVAALRRCAKEHQANDHLTVDLEINGERRLPLPVEECLYKVAQEAVNNIIKHAHTDHAAIHLGLDEDPIWMVIQDYGAGFDPKAAGKSAGHLGLTSMAERVQAIGGNLFIESTPGSGTRIRVENIRIEEKEHA